MAIFSLYTYPEIKKPPTQSGKAIYTLGICIIMGCLGCVLYSCQASKIYEFFSVLGTGLLISGASLVSGCLLGFLFGIPRALQAEKTEVNNVSLQPAVDSNGKVERKDENGTAYRPNTNLEQISDWLTKILVGISLVQINSFPGLLIRYANFISPGIGNYNSSKVFAITILFFYLTCGFLIGYLWTRLYFAGALRQADLDAVGTKIAEVENKVSEIEKQVAVDAKALSLVQQQLNPTIGANPVSQNDLNAAIIPASSNIKAQIYYIAYGVRSQNWQERQNKPIMERSIPIFRALIASDPDELYHMNHGQLGFALKDQRIPDWKEAEKVLAKAIEIRGDNHGWLLYEFNRAICKIQLDKDFANKTRSGEEIKRSIVKDLETAKRSSDLKEILVKVPVITEWLELNK
jgi:hypothetical protein